MNKFTKELQTAGATCANVHKCHLYHTGQTVNVNKECHMYHTRRTINQSKWLEHGVW